MKRDGVEVTLGGKRVSFPSSCECAVAFSEPYNIRVAYKIQIRRAAGTMHDVGTGGRNAVSGKNIESNGEASGYWRSTIHGVVNSVRG